MAVRSDQAPPHPRLRPPDLHSHQFVLQRAVGALAMRDPDPASSPLRRIGGSLFAGVMVSVLAVAAVGIYGLLRPGGGGSWRDGRSTIIEQETGARFVFLNGTLHPVLNHTSAMLILGTSATVRVARNELLGVPRGTAVGIPGAPDPLPARDQLLTDPWSLCSRPTASSTAESVLRVGWTPAQAPLGDGGVLATDPVGGSHLLWHGRRYALRSPEVVLAALTWTQATAMPAAVLNAIPAGLDLGPVPTPRSGEASAVSGLRVGEVFVVTNPDGDRLFGVTLAHGVSAVTAVQAAILVAAGANDGHPARDLSPAAYAAAPKLGPLTPTGDDAPPANTPTQVRPGEHGGVCATFAGGAALPTLTVTDDLTPLSGAVATSPSAGAVRADRIAVPPGRAVVVESLAGPDSPAGSLAVVSDLGLRFAVPSTQVLGMLGYADVPAVRLPAALVALLPAGRALDPALAVLPAPI